MSYREEIVEKIIVYSALNNDEIMESALREASLEEIARAIYYMESDDREFILNLLSPSDSSEVLSLLRRIEDEVQAGITVETLPLEEAVLEEEPIYEVEVKEHLWKNVTSPTEEELRALSEEHNIPIDLLLSPLDIDERPRVEIDGRNTLIIIRTPQSNKTGRMLYITVPLGMIFSEDVILTISPTDNEVIERLLRKRGISQTVTDRSKFILDIFLLTAFTYLNYLKEISDLTTKAESRILRALTSKELLSMFNLERSLLYFSTSLRANEIVLDRLYRSGILGVESEEITLLEDVFIENRQAIDITNIYSDILTNTMDVFGSIIANNLNRVMRLLTVLSIALDATTVFPSIYGMNVGLPFQNSAFAFSLTMCMTVVFSILTAIILIKRKFI